MLHLRARPPLGVLVAAFLAALALMPIVRGITAELVHTTGALLTAAPSCAVPSTADCARAGAEPRFAHANPSR